MFAPDTEGISYKNKLNIYTDPYYVDSSLNTRDLATFQITKTDSSPHRALFPPPSPKHTALGKSMSNLQAKACLSQNSQVIQDFLLSHFNTMRKRNIQSLLSAKTKKHQAMNGGLLSW